jgi:hypothetical protein
VRVDRPLFLLCVLLTACAPDVDGAWREEVVLKDGRVITVSRQVTWEEIQPWGQAKSYAIKKASLSLPVPRAPEWRSSRENVVLVDFDEPRREYVVITTPATCGSYAAAGRPEPPYFEYRLREGRWQRVTFSRELASSYPNVLVYPNEGAEPPLVTAAEKLERIKRGEKRTGRRPETLGEGSMSAC